MIQVVSCALLWEISVVVEFFKCIYLLWVHSEQETTNLVFSIQNLLIFVFVYFLTNEIKCALLLLTFLVAMLKHFTNQFKEGRVYFRLTVQGNTVYNGRKGMAFTVWKLRAVICSYEQLYGYKGRTNHFILYLKR